MSTVKGWHFLRADKKLANSDGREVRVGEWVEVPGPVKLCERGLHASAKLIDALSFLSWEPAVLCRVELGGEIVQDADKCVATRRRVLWMAETGVEAMLRDFALRCGTKVLQEHYPDAPIELWHAMDLRAAIEAGVEVDAAARDAARAAARDAARAASMDAAWGAAMDAASAASAAASAAAWDAASAAARDAASAAAMDAAWGVAWGAASAAARDAARAAAWAATRAAVRDAARDATNRELERMAYELPGLP